MKTWAFAIALLALVAAFPAHAAKDALPRLAQEVDND